MISSAASATSPSNTFPRYFGEKQDKDQLSILVMQPAIRPPIASSMKTPKRLNIPGFLVS
jgi:hypothetical protein